MQGKRVGALSSPLELTAFKQCSLAAGLIDDAAMAKIEVAFESAGTAKYEMREE